MSRPKYLISLKTLQRKIYNKLCHDEYGLVLREGFISKLAAMPEQTRSLYLNKMTSSDIIPFFSESERCQYQYQPNKYFIDIKHVDHCNCIQRKIILNAIFNQMNRKRSAIICIKEMNKMLSNFNFDETIDIALGLHIPLESEHLVLKHVNLLPGKRVILEPVITEANLEESLKMPPKEEYYHYHQNLGNHFFIGLIALIVASKMIILHHDMKSKGSKLGVLSLPLPILKTLNVTDANSKQTDTESITMVQDASSTSTTATTAAQVVVPTAKEHDPWVIIDHVAIPIEIDMQSEIVFPTSLRFGGTLLKKLKKEFTVCQYTIVDPTPLSE